MSAPLLYYPLIAEGDYANLAELCERRGFDRDLVDRYAANGAIERSELVLCDRIVLGDADSKACAALRVGSNGVKLWAALIGETNADREEVLGVIALMREKLPGHEIMLAEFVPTPHTWN